MSILERAMEHATRQAGELRPVPVPEWGETIYYRPILTAGDRNAIEKSQTKGTTEAAIQTLIRRARDAEGKPIFSAGDIDKLRNNVDSAVIVRLAGEIINGSDAGVSGLGEPGGLSPPPGGSSSATTF